MFRKTFFVASAALAAVFFLFGCTAKWAEVDLRAGEAPPVVDGEKLFGYEKAPITARESLVEKAGDYDLVRVSFPSYYQDDESNRLVTALSLVLPFQP